MSEIYVADLFCGAGGLSMGLHQAGLKVVSGADLEPACRFPFEFNHPGATFVQGDIGALSETQLWEMLPAGGVRVLAGCPPCQPYSQFSVKGRRVMDQEALDRDAAPMRAFIRAAQILRPDILLMENVPRLGSMNYPVWTELLARLSEMGYAVDSRVVRVSDYGVPQTRRRLLLIASRLGEVQLPVSTGGAPSVGEVLRRAALSGLEAGGRCESDDLHRTSGLSDINLRRVRLSRPGGSWLDWPEELRLDCHRRDSGQSYSAVYGRLHPDELCSTITTQFTSVGTGRFTHPWEDRALSLREGALMQTFPPEFRFYPAGTCPPVGVVARLIGNAVPPRLGQVLGEVVLDHVSRSAAVRACA